METGWGSHNNNKIKHEVNNSNNGNDNGEDTSPTGYLLDDDVRVKLELVRKLPKQTVNKSKKARYKFITSYLKNDVRTLKSTIVTTAATAAAAAAAASAVANANGGIRHDDTHSALNHTDVSEIDLHPYIKQFKGICRIAGSFAEDSGRAVITNTNVPPRKSIKRLQSQIKEIGKAYRIQEAHRQEQQQQSTDHHSQVGGRQRHSIGMGIRHYHRSGRGSTNGGELNLSMSPDVPKEIFLASEEDNHDDEGKSHHNDKESNSPSTNDGRNDGGTIAKVVGQHPHKEDDRQTPKKRRADVIIADAASRGVAIIEQSSTSTTADVNEQEKSLLLDDLNCHKNSNNNHNHRRRIPAHKQGGRGSTATSHSSSVVTMKRKRVEDGVEGGTAMPANPAATAARKKQKS